MIFHELGKRGVDISISFRAEYSVPYHQLCIIPLTAHSKKRLSLIKVQSSVGYRYKHKDLNGNLIAWPFSKIIIIDTTHGLFRRIIVQGIKFSSVEQPSNPISKHLVNALTIMPLLETGIFCVIGLYYNIYDSELGKTVKCLFLHSLLHNIFTLCKLTTVEEFTWTVWILFLYILQPVHVVSSAIEWQCLVVVGNQGQRRYCIVL